MSSYDAFMFHCNIYDISGTPPPPPPACFICVFGYLLFCFVLYFLQKLFGVSCNESFLPKWVNLRRLPSIGMFTDNIVCWEPEAALSILKDVPLRTRGRCWLSMYIDSGDSALLALNWVTDDNSNTIAIIPTIMKPHPHPLLPSPLHTLPRENPTLIIVIQVWIKELIHIWVEFV